MCRDRYFLHFKGGLYKMVAVAKNSETLEDVIVYQALYGERAVWVRPEKMFFETVLINGIQIPRFKEITKEEMICLSQQMK